MATLLALACASVYGAADFLGGLASRRNPPLAVTLLATMAAVVAALILWPIAGGDLSGRAVAVGAMGGVCGVAGIVMLYTALSNGPFQVVSPVTAVTSAIVPVTWGILAGERPTALGLAGLALAFPAIWLLSGGTTSAPTDLPKVPLIQGALAGVSFGAFFVFLSYAPDGSGMVPVVAAKSSALVAVALVSLSRPTPRLPTTQRLGATMSGVLDMTANGLFLAASKLGDLSVVGALASLFPASNALLAAVFLGERLGRTQMIGFAAALASGALLSA